MVAVVIWLRNDGKSLKVVNIFIEKTANKQKENDPLALWLVSDTAAQEGNLDASSLISDSLC